MIHVLKVKVLHVREHRVENGNTMQLLGADLESEAAVQSDVMRRWLKELSCLNGVSAGVGKLHFAASTALIRCDDSRHEHGTFCCNTWKQGEGDMHHDWTKEE